MGSGTEGTLSKAADSTRLCAVTDTLKGRDDIQSDLGRLERWFCEPHEVQHSQVQGSAPGLERSQVQIEVGQIMD